MFRSTLAFGNPFVKLGGKVIKGVPTNLKKGLNLFDYYSSDLGDLEAVIIVP
jgi:hypothetical protein